MCETPDLLEWAEEQERKKISAAVDSMEEKIENAPSGSVAEKVCDTVPLPEHERVVLIDAFSQIFRSFYAIRQLNNHRGEPVNALYVMTKLLLQMEKNYSSSGGAMLFDCGKVAFRLELLPEYKANRPPMPEELKCQMPKIEEMAQAFGWPLLRAENYEADDLIGGFSASCGTQVLIVTGDKDLSSLVDERVHLLKPARSGGGFQECGPEEVLQDFGVEPALIPDYLALLGDSVDNIDGVPGIGAKSAALLLNSFGAIDGWYDEEGELKFESSKFSGKLAGKKELLKRNLALTRLKCELPEAFRDPAVLCKKAPDWQKIANLCAENDFKSLLKEIPAEPDLPGSEDELF